jgi:hypothetical protein
LIEASCFYKDHNKPERTYIPVLNLFVVPGSFIAHTANDFLTLELELLFILLQLSLPHVIDRLVLIAKGVLSFLLRALDLRDLA